MVKSTDYAIPAGEGEALPRPAVKSNTAVKFLGSSKEHLAEIDRRAGADVLEVLIEPLPSCLPPFVAQSAQQAPFRVELRRCTKLRHETIVADPVHKHATVSVSVQLAIIDQSRRKGDRAHFPHQ